MGGLRSFERSLGDQLEEVMQTILAELSVYSLSEFHGRFQLRLLILPVHCLQHLREASRQCRRPYIRIIVRIDVLLVIFNRLEIAPLGNLLLSLRRMSNDLLISPQAHFCG